MQLSRAGLPQNELPNLHVKGMEACPGTGSNRNASEHALENSVVSTQAMYTRPQIATMLYAIFSLLLHSLMRQQDRLGMIREIEVELLFVYGRDA